MPLRPYLLADWPQLCAVHDAARQDELAASGLGQAFLSLEQTAQNEGLFDGELWVDEEGGCVRGFAAWAEHELTWLYVDPKAYRQGVGRRLLRHAIEACGGRIGTEVLVGNEPALALYLSEGFTVAKRVDGKLAGNEAFAASGYVLQRVPGRA